ncbi:MAG: type VI secretion system baseplate subunit TssF, partial [Nannocystaceae bacterium]
MSFQQDFKAELDALRESAQLFARRVPELAPQLLEPGNDPDVERLLEGVAFLVASYRIKNNEHATQIAHHVAEQLLPQVLATRPAATIVEFTPKIKALSLPHKIPRGTDLKCLPIDGTSCRFTTCLDTYLWPLELSDAALSWRELSLPRLTLKFLLGKHGARSLATSTPLRLFVWKPGDQVVSDTASTLAYWLTMQLSSMSVERRGECTEVPGGAVSFVDPLKHPVMPWPEAVSPSLRCIVEYFYLPERFHFLEIHGLEDLEIEDEELVVHFDFERTPQVKLDVTAACFRLHCTPAINLFPVPGEPFRLSPVQGRALVRADDIRADHMEVYQVNQLASVGRHASEVPRYTERETGDTCAYKLHREHSKLDAGVDTYLSLIHSSPPCLDELDLSLELLCTNRALPEKLRVGDIQGSSQKSLYKSYRNLTRVTPPTPMALGDEALWRLVAHLSHGARLAKSATELRELLRIYEFTSKGSADGLANNRAIDAIASVALSRTPWMYDGVPIHALKVEVVLDEAPFPNLGRAYIFGSVLALVYRNLAPLNSVIQFVLQ